DRNQVEPLRHADDVPGRPPRYHPLQVGRSAERAHFERSAGQTDPGSANPTYHGSPESSSNESQLLFGWHRQGNLSDRLSHLEHPSGLGDEWLDPAFGLCSFCEDACCPSPQFYSVVDDRIADIPWVAHHENFTA